MSPLGDESLELLVLNKLLAKMGQDFATKFETMVAWSDDETYSRTGGPLGGGHGLGTSHNEPIRKRDKSPDGSPQHKHKKRHNVRNSLLRVPDRDRTGNPTTDMILFGAHQKPITPRSFL